MRICQMYRSPNLPTLVSDMIKPRQGVQNRTIVNVLMNMLIAAYNRTIAFDAEDECFLFLEMPLKNEPMVETMLQAIEQARATSVGK